VKHSSLQPPSAKGLIYRIPVKVQAVEPLQALQAQHVKFVNRFQISSTDTSELTDTGTVLLRFSTLEIPGVDRIGYLLFKVRQYVAKPVRCFNCNRFGHKESLQK